MKLALIADKIALGLWRSRSERIVPYEVIRDACDEASGGDLSTRMLDRLADMVEKRLGNQTTIWRLKLRAAQEMDRHLLQSAAPRG